MNDTYIARKLAVLLILLLTFTGCDTVDTGNEEPVAPAVIPEAAFAMNLSSVDQDESASKQGDAFSHWFNAAVRASIATHVAYAILHVPVEMTAAVQGVEPVYNGTAWVWTAETMIEGQRNAIDLRARPNGNAVEWDMKISGVIEETGQYLENFLLYTAVTQTDAQQGTFQVYFPTESGSQKVLDGSYNIDEATGETLAFDIPADVEDIGGASAIFNHNDDYVTLDLMGPEGGNHLIEWDELTNAGALTADDYNNGEKSCWDTDLKNTACEPAS
ncbi:MAG: hypothetical protein AAF564_11135 [Bacteroidota bacterium]